MSCDHCEMRYYGCQCTAPTPRDNTTGFIRHDQRKFPRGMAAVAADLHTLGLRMGLYVAAGSASRRRDCQSAATPSTFSRCFNRDEQGVSSE